MQAGGKPDHPFDNDSDDDDDEDEDLEHDAVDDDVDVDVDLDVGDDDLSKRRPAHLPRILRHRVLAAVGAKPSYLAYDVFVFALIHSHDINHITTMIIESISNAY